MASPVVVITGASQGIGAAIAEVFAAEVPGVRPALSKPLGVARPPAKAALSTVRPGP